MKLNNKKQQEFLLELIENISVPGRFVEKTIKLRNSIQNSEIGEKLKFDNQEQKNMVLQIIDNSNIPGQALDFVYQFKKKIVQN